MRTCADKGWINSPSALIFAVGPGGTTCPPRWTTASRACRQRCNSPAVAVAVIAPLCPNFSSVTGKQNSIESVQCIKSVFRNRIEDYTGRRIAYPQGGTLARWQISPRGCRRPASAGPPASPPARQRRPLTTASSSASVAAGAAAYGSARSSEMPSAIMRSGQSAGGAGQAGTTRRLFRFYRVSFIVGIAC